jgi:glycosyltransferase involved in cell wall biosynthesis
LPWFWSGIWSDWSAFQSCRRLVRERQSSQAFDAVLAFDLAAAGGLACRLGRELGIPTAGWAIGGDVHLASSWLERRVLLHACRNLDLVFFQSRELLENVGRRFGLESGSISGNHLVLPRGVPEPPSLRWSAVRLRVRAEWDVAADQVVVLNVGRVVRDKGVMDLVEAMSAVARSHDKVICVFAGSTPGLDDTSMVERAIAADPQLRGKVRIVPACSPDGVWEWLCGADIFAFPSHREGMPNSLLEAMLMGLPAVAFDIPAVREIMNDTACIAAVPRGNVPLLAQAILRLALSPEDRARLGKKGCSRVRENFMIRQRTSEALSRLTELVERRRALDSDAEPVSATGGRS